MGMNQEFVVGMNQEWALSIHSECHNMHIVPGRKAKRLPNRRVEFVSHKGSETLTAAHEHSGGDVQHTAVRP
jgi:hypothetical protein